VFSFDLTRTCQLETLLCTGFGFHLWHDLTLF
jgi:hypothetical protein